MRKKSKQMAMGGMIAAFYVVFTLIAASVGLSSGVIQFRISEALCVLPMFTSAAIPGLAIGCLVSNLVSGCVMWDVIFGMIATLIGAIGTRLLRKYRWIAPLCPVVSNMVIVPFILQHAYHVEDGYFFLLETVGVGEFVCAYILGQIVIDLVRRRHLVKEEAK